MSAAGVSLFARAGPGVCSLQRAPARLRRGQVAAGSGGQAAHGRRQQLAVQATLVNNSGDNGASARLRDSQSAGASSGASSGPTSGGVQLSPRELGLQEYATLKGDMLRNTAQLGAFLTLYLGLTQHDTMAFASGAIGAAGSLAYMALLCRHVDNLGKDNVWAFAKNSNPGDNLLGLIGGAIGRVGDVYKNALLHPQLLVPVAMAAGCSAWNSADLGPDILYFDVFICFFTYKVVVLDQGWRALKKVMLVKDDSPARPVIPKFDERDDLLV